MTESKNILCLLSLAYHPQSARLMPNPTDIKAIAYAKKLSHQLNQLAGLSNQKNSQNNTNKIFYLHLLNQADSIEDSDYQKALTDYFAYQVQQIYYAYSPNSANQLISSFVEEHGIDYVICGLRANGHFDSGLFAFEIAHHLKMNLFSQLIDFEWANNQLKLEQFLPRGMRRKLNLSHQAVLSIHPNCPLKQAYIFSAKKQGQLEEFSFEALIEKQEKYPYSFENWQKMSQKSLKTHLQLEDKQTTNQANQRMNQFVNLAQLNSQTKIIENESLDNKVKAILNSLTEFDLLHQGHSDV